VSVIQVPTISCARYSNCHEKFSILSRYVSARKRRRILEAWLVNATYTRACGCERGCPFRISFDTPLGCRTSLDVHVRCTEGGTSVVFV
jgi:hypothetical protein